MSFLEDRIRKGGRVIPPAFLETWYRERLDALCRAMFSADYSGVSRSRIRAVFAREAESLSKQFSRDCVEQSAAAFMRSTKRLAKRGVERDYRVDAPEVVVAARAIERENAELIRSIPEVFFEKVDKARDDYAGDEQGYEQRLAEIHRITYGRMKLIAHDQTNKAAEGLALHRLSANGIHWVMWRHSHLSVVPRDYHKTKWDGHSGLRNGRPNGLNGFIFRIDDPPVIDLKTGERGYPSQLINCKCFLIPVQKKYLTPVDNGG